MLMIMIMIIIYQIVAIILIGETSSSQGLSRLLRRYFQLLMIVMIVIIMTVAAETRPACVYIDKTILNHLYTWILLTITLHDPSVFRSLSGRTNSTYQRCQCLKLSEKGSVSGMLHIVKNG